MMRMLILFCAFFFFFCGCGDDKPVPYTPPPAFKNAVRLKCATNQFNDFVWMTEEGEFMGDSNYLKAFGIVMRFKLVDVSGEFTKQNFTADVLVVAGLDAQGDPTSAGHDVFYCNNETGPVCPDDAERMGFIETHRCRGPGKPTVLQVQSNANGEIVVVLRSSRVKDDGTLFPRYHESVSSLGFVNVFVRVVKVEGGHSIYGGAAWYMSQSLLLFCNQIKGCSRVTSLDNAGTSFNYWLQKYVGDPPEKSPDGPVSSNMPMTAPDIPWAGTNCPCEAHQTDSDYDWFNDCSEECPEDPEKQDAGQCGCGIADTDSDGDGAADCVDACPDFWKSAGPTCVFGDFDDDMDVDQVDFGIFQRCYYASNCPGMDADGDIDVDLDDFAYFERCYSGPAVPVDDMCANDQ